MTKKRFISALVIVALGFGAWVLFNRIDDKPADKPKFGITGVVHVPAFELPPSRYMSSYSAKMLSIRAVMPSMDFPPKGEISKIRQDMEKMVSPLVALMKEKYPADVVEKTIAGVRTRVITPKGIDTDPERLLINLHGGAFSLCADGCGLLESLPIASLGKYKVVSIDYRMAPEATFPAASEDVAAVYQELLKQYQPNKIGIYGCSAGGVLTGEVAAWLPQHNLPQPGAIGIFGAGAGGMGTGDSAYIAGHIDGSFPPPNASGEMPPFPYRSYFDGVDLKDPLVTPMLHLDVLAKFPPTLVITGTRATDMSPAVFTHSQLLKAGVKSNLVVGEGMGHCYMYLSMFPEAQDAYNVIVRFFQENLH